MCLVCLKAQFTNEYCRSKNGLWMDQKMILLIPIRLILAFVGILIEPSLACYVIDLIYCKQPTQTQRNIIARIQNETYTEQKQNYISLSPRLCNYILLNRRDLWTLRYYTGAILTTCTGLVALCFTASSTTDTGSAPAVMYLLWKCSWNRSIWY